MLVKFTDDVKLPKSDLCVVGAGPVGIALALACEAKGLSVLLVESGGEEPSSFSSELSRAEIVDPRHHAPMDEATCRAVGGTSLLWGRCCVPYDDIDFADRPYAREAQWPIAHSEVSPWYPAAADFFRCGTAQFTSKAASWPNLRGVAFNSLARWARRRNVAAEHRLRLLHSKAITVLHDATVIELGFSGDGGRLEQIAVTNKSASMRIKVGTCVLACGGLETTRLLLAAQRARPDVLGAPGGPLGRNYMGHLDGTIADLVLDDPAKVEAFDFFHADGGYARRRFTFPAEVQTAEGLFNIALWLENPPIYDIVYENGTLSLVWLALTIPLIGKRLGIRNKRHLGRDRLEIRRPGLRASRFLAHLKNITNSPFQTSVNLAKLVWDRYFCQRGKPTLLVANKGGRYPLHYMAEQVPNEQSRVWLSEEEDALGLPRLCIDLRFSEADAESVLRAHHLLDVAVREAHLGRLEYRVAEDQRLEKIIVQARDGSHQIGTTRMGRSQETSVVDRNCKVHGVKNLYIASSSVFPSSGQANPTFLAVVMGIRLADHLSKTVPDGNVASVRRSIDLPDSLDRAAVTAASRA